MSLPPDLDPPPEAGRSFSDEVCAQLRFTAGDESLTRLGLVSWGLGFLNRFPYRRPGSPTVRVGLLQSSFLTLRLPGSAKTARRATSWRFYRELGELTPSQLTKLARQAHGLKLIPVEDPKRIGWAAEEV